MRKLTTTLILATLTAFGACAQEDEAEPAAAELATEPAAAADTDTAAPGKAKRRRGRRGDITKFDTDGDGTLDDSERQAMHQTRVDGLMSRLDADGSGDLSKAELEAADGRMARRLADFAAIDKDGSGAVSKEELGEVMKKRGPRGPRGKRGGERGGDTM